jgi:hypothetical protein
MKWVAPITFLVLTIAACITVVFVKALKPTSTGAFLFFAAWLVLPYAVATAALITLRRKGNASVRWHLVATLVSVGGVLFLTDVIFWRPDAQGAIAVLMTPILQGVVTVVLVAVISWISRNASA